MQKISLIAQSVLELSHREKVHDDNNNNDNDDDADTNPPWIIVRDGIYSVADKNIWLIMSTWTWFLSDIYFDGYTAFFEEIF